MGGIRGKREEVCDGGAGPSRPRREKLTDDAKTFVVGENCPSNQRTQESGETFPIFIRDVVALIASFSLAAVWLT